MTDARESAIERGREIRSLANRLAYTAARAASETCAEDGQDKRGHWWDTAQCRSIDEERVAMAVRYLDLRNLLRFHAEKAGAVQILDNRQDDDYVLPKLHPLPLPR